MSVHKARPGVKPQGRAGMRLPDTASTGRQGRGARARLGRGVGDGDARGGVQRELRVELEAVDGELEVAAAALLVRAQVEHLLARQLARARLALWVPPAAPEITS